MQLHMDAPMAIATMGGDEDVLDRGFERRLWIRAMVSLLVVKVGRTGETSDR